MLVKNLTIGTDKNIADKMALVKSYFFKHIDIMLKDKIKIPINNTIMYYFYSY
ncbi:hypothetical protein GCM10023142_15620 [Anaerocolumna aminovalerica]